MGTEIADGGFHIGHAVFVGRAIPNGPVLNAGNYKTGLGYERPQIEGEFLASHDEAAAGNIDHQRLGAPARRHLQIKRQGFDRRRWPGVAG